jgi:hypothetical protein
MPKLVVLEVKEVPLRVLRKYAELKPTSHISALLQDSLVLTSEARDVPEAKLYPSQTWASQNTGTAYGKHQIYFYNDPKPDSYPMYWRIAAERGQTVGLVNTLHSSPAHRDYERANYLFVIPDCFAADSYTKPATYVPFQSLNLTATKKSGRVASLTLPVKELLRLVPTLPRLGIRPQTYRYCAEVAIGVAARKINRERLRLLQFPLIADIFLRALSETQPHLAILFTNHVAANMHRYWYALFPEDYGKQCYGPEWTHKYRGEILASLDILDPYLARLMAYCRESRSVLVVTSSMGQRAKDDLPERIDRQVSRGYRLERVGRFIGAVLDSAPAYRLESAMVPQHTLKFENQETARRMADRLDKRRPELKHIVLNLSLNRDTLTVSVELDPREERFYIAGRAYTATQLGFVEFSIDDHHAGDHCKQGSLIVFNSSSAAAKCDTVDYLEYAPAVLEYLGVGRKPYMVEPTFKI